MICDKFLSGTDKNQIKIYLIILINTFVNFQEKTVSPNFRTEQQNNLFEGGVYGLHDGATLHLQYNAYNTEKRVYDLPRSWQRPAICTQRTSRSLMRDSEFSDGSSNCFALKAFTSSPAKCPTLYHKTHSSP